jgi:ubiquinone/menaquinone biosynthesis C-methylase UbiE
VVTDAQPGGQPPDELPTPRDSYAAAFASGTTEAERQRLDLQAAMYGRLSAWTVDALGLASGDRVADLGCGSGPLLHMLAERVGPTGSVIGVDRDAHLLQAARAQVAAYPWVELVEADALAYDAGGGSLDAAHCRLVLLHQPDPQAFLDHMVGLVRSGGRIAVQEVDADGPTGAPTVLCYPSFPTLERLGTAYLTTSLRRGSDSQAGRKVLDRFRQAGLTDLRTEAQAAFVPLPDPRASTMLDLFARPGAGQEVEAFGVMSAAEYDELLTEVQRAHNDPAYAACLFRLWTVVATVGTKPAN